MERLEQGQIKQKEKVMIDLALGIPIIIAIILAFCGIMATIETRNK